MAGTAITPAELPGIVMSSEANIYINNPVTASQVNALRIAAVIDRLAVNMQSQSATAKNDTVESFNLCLSLARGIDFAIANQEIPSRALDLPAILKQVLAVKFCC